MTINDTISRTAASNPLVGVAVAQQSVKSAILTALQTGDAGTTALLAAIAGKTQTTNPLAASSAASLAANAVPNLGKNINTTA